MTVATFAQPDMTAELGNDYKAKLDAAIAVLAEMASHFAAHEQSTPDMTVKVDAGRIWNVDTDSLTSVAAQDTATITAPTTNPRKDIVYVDETTGTVGVATGAEAASPTDPAVPAGKLPVARITLATTTTEITNTLLDDLRSAYPTGWLKSDGDGSGLTGITAGASNGDMRLAFLRIAENAGDRLSMTAGIADPFTDETDVDAATSTNERYDPAGSFYEGRTASTSYTNAGGQGDRTGSITVTISGALLYSGTASNLVDGAVADNTSDTMVFNNAVAVSGYSIEFYFGASSAKVITEVTWKQSNTTTHGTWRLQGSNNGTDWTTIGADFTLGGATSQVITAPSANATEYDYYRLYGVSGSTSNSSWNREVEFKIGTLSTVNMTLVSNAFTATAAPDTARVSLQALPIDSITVNTDLTVEVSRDSGATWTAATLALTATLGDGTKIYEDDAIDISGQPIDTSMKYRVKTLNTKHVEVHGVVLQWS